MHHAGRTPEYQTMSLPSAADLRNAVNEFLDELVEPDKRPKKLAVNWIDFACTRAVVGKDEDGYPAAIVWVGGCSPDNAELSARLYDHLVLEYPALGGPGVDVVLEW